MAFKDVIFDLDGVICFTDEYHYLARQALTAQKNDLYKEYLKQMTPADQRDKVTSTLDTLRANGCLVTEAAISGAEAGHHGCFKAACTADAGKAGVGG